MGKDWRYDEGWDWTTCSWHEHEHPKQQQQKFFRLQPPRPAAESKIAVVGKSKAAAADPLTQFLQAVASKGRQLLESGSAAAADGSDAGSTAEHADVAVAAVGLDPDQQQDEDAVSVAGAGKGEQKQAGRTHKRKHEAAPSSSSSRSSTSGAEVETSESSAPPPYDAPGVRHATANSGASARRSPFLPAASSSDDESSDGLYDIDYEDDSEGADEDSVSSAREDGAGTGQASKPSSGKAKNSSSSSNSNSAKTAAPNAARTKPSSPAAPSQSKPNAVQRQLPATKGKSAAPTPSMPVLDVADDEDEGAQVLRVEDLDKLNGLDITDVAGVQDQGKAAEQGWHPQVKPQEQQQQKQKQQQKPAQKPAPALSAPTTKTSKDTPKPQEKQAPAPAKTPPLCSNPTPGAQSSQSPPSACAGSPHVRQGQQCANWQCIELPVKTDSKGAGVQRLCT
jgi:hypothetical protein